MVYCCLAVKVVPAVASGVLQDLKLGELLGRRDAHA